MPEAEDKNRADRSRADRSRPDILHCPVCGRELEAGRMKAEGGWECRCGEFVPRPLALSSFEGCTHGRNCNCGREMRR